MSKRLIRKKAKMASFRAFVLIVLGKQTEWRRLYPAWLWILFRYGGVRWCLLKNVSSFHEQKHTVLRVLLALGSKAP